MNFTMQRQYAPLGARGFWARQFSRAGATTARVIKRGITSDTDTESSVTPEPGAPGGAPKSKLPLYAGLGVAGLLLLSFFGKRH